MPKNRRTPAESVIERLDPPIDSQGVSELSPVTTRFDGGMRFQLIQKGRQTKKNKNNTQKHGKNTKIRSNPKKTYMTWCHFSVKHGFFFLSPGIHSGELT